MSVQTRFFHVTIASLWAGDIIQPGRFGTTLRQFRPGGPYPSANDLGTVLWELALESARQSIDPELPSRLDCVFACTTFADAAFFRSNFKRDGSILEVELVHPESRLHHGCFGILASYKSSEPYMDFLPQAARRYWTDKPTGAAEVVVGGPLRVVGPAE